MIFKAIADNLRALPMQAFNMDAWTNDDPDCGTVYCALGWAAHCKVVPGLSLTDSGAVVYEGRQSWNGAVHMVEDHLNGTGLPYYNNFDYQLAHHLFNGEYYRSDRAPTVEEVIDRLEQAECVITLLRFAKALRTPQENLS